MRKSGTGTAWVALLALLAAGCSSGPKAPPSEAAARQVFENVLRDPLKSGRMRLRSFTKLGAYETLPSTYVVEFKAEIECLQDARYAGEMVGKWAWGTRHAPRAGELIVLEMRHNSASITFDAGQPTPGTALIKEKNLSYGTDVQRTLGPGMREVKYEETVQNPGLWFTRTSRGWEGEDHNIY
jgi:hypothetical protein